MGKSETPGITGNSETVEHNMQLSLLWVPVLYIDILNDALSRTFYTENVAFPCLWPRNIDRTSAPVNQTRQRPVGLCGYFHFQRENSTITNRYPITANGHYFVKKSRKKL